MRALQTTVSSVMTVISIFLCALLFESRTVFGTIGVSGPSRSQIQSMLSQIDSNGHGYITPTTPPPAEVNCYVEVTETIVQGGRCVQFGRNSNMWSCQSGIHMDRDNEECEQRARNRRNNRRQRASRP